MAMGFPWFGRTKPRPSGSVMIAPRSGVTAPAAQATDAPDRGAHASPTPSEALALLKAGNAAFLSGETQLGHVTAKDLEPLQGGQKPIATKARTSIAGFKLREGMTIGCKVTLRKDQMYEFLDRLITIALPRVKDFRGLKPTSFDGRGNYAMGLKEHIVFPEINYDQIDQIWGMDIIVTTTAKTDDEARELLKEFQFPFVQQQQQ